MRGGHRHAPDQGVLRRRGSGKEKGGGIKVRGAEPRSTSDAVALYDAITADSVRICVEDGLMSSQ